MIRDPPIILRFWGANDGSGSRLRWAVMLLAIECARSLRLPGAGSPGTACPAADGRFSEAATFTILKN